MISEKKRIPKRKLTTIYMLYEPCVWSGPLFLFGYMAPGTPKTRVVGVWGPSGGNELPTGQIQENKSRESLACECYLNALKSVCILNVRAIKPAASVLYILSRTKHYSRLVRSHTVIHWLEHFSIPTVWYIPIYILNYHCICLI